MTPNRYITLLYQAFTKHDITIIMSGDNNQCDPINKNGLLQYDYFNDSIVFYLCSINFDRKQTAIYNARISKITSTQFL